VIDRADWRRLGTVLGESGKTYVQVDRESEALPLGGLYFLTPSKETDGPPIAAGGVGAQDLLASTFVVSIAAPARLMSLLDLCSTIAANVPLFRARVDPGMGADHLAGAVMEHASSLAAGELELTA
jgi:hypothetical protein